MGNFTDTIQLVIYIAIGVAALGLTAGIAYMFIQLRRHGVIGIKEKKAKPLPKHACPANAINPNWTDDNYERMIAGTHAEILSAIRQRDRETLGMLCPGPALASYASRLEGDAGSEDLREALQGSFRRSWDPASNKLVAVLAVTRWQGGWRRFYEEWTLQRQGNAWFLLDRKPTKI